MTENKTGIELIAEERKRQIEKEKWDSDHDDDHWNGELSKAGACYALGSSHVSKRFHRDDGIVDIRIELWPWEEKWWKPTPKNRIKELVKAGALIAAEIDRLQRQKDTF